MSHAILAIPGETKSTERVEKELAKLPDATVVWLNPRGPTVRAMALRYPTPLIVYEGTQRIFGTESIISFVKDRLLFTRLRGEWKRAIGPHSIMKRAEEDDAFRTIVEAGMRMVPFMLEDMKDNNTNWIPALSQVVGQEPQMDSSVPRTFETVKQAWLSWGIASQFLSEV